MMHRGTSTLYLEFEHPEVDVTDKALIEVKWMYFPEIPPTFGNEYGEPYDFTFDVRVVHKPEWVTLDMIDDALVEMTIDEIMNP